ncbi:MAG: DNA primase [Lentisphaeria bacterium]|nr:DNA primase [Lentisphaeria bacterium]
MSLDLNKEVIEEIRQRCDIADVISGCGVQLKRSGASTFKGLCPFHQEKTPSFHVDITRQTFHCFGCGKGGDVFRFFMDKENLDFINAAQILAARANVLIPEKNDGHRESPGKRSERERMFAINAEFSNFFCRYLRDNPNSPAAIYLAKRNIPRDVADKFRIGAVPDSWTACKEYGLSRGFTEADMITAGILRRKEDTGRVYDQFKGRLTFTIENEQGKPVGFSARSLEPKPLDGRKYLNTPETPVFHKGHLLYALPQARQGINKFKYAILCEGQLDAIAFHRAGFECAIAPLGTAFTPDQAKIIRRYTSNIILAFDADGAGRKAVLRAAEILLPLSVDLKVLQIPGGKDPDELFANGGEHAVADALHNNTVSWLTILQETLPEKFDLSSPVGRSQAAAFVASFLKLLNNQVELEVYTREAAKMLDISENAMKIELSDARRDNQFRSAAAAVPPSAKTVDKKAKSVANAALITLLELAIADPDTGRLLSEVLPLEYIPDDAVGKALNMAINAALNEEHDSLHSELSNLLIEFPSPEVSRVISLPTEFQHDAKKKALQDAIGELFSANRRKSEQELLAKLRIAASQEEKMKILMELQSIQSANNQQENRI